MKNYSLTTVMNVITEEKQSFTNRADLETNLISAIIYSFGVRSKLLHFAYRNEIAREAKIEKIYSANGQAKFYSPAFDMIAYLGS